MTGESPGRRLAGVLRKQSERIMLSWEERVRVEIDGARMQNRIALRDHLPRFLERLGEALDPKYPLDNAAANTAICEIHGKERADLLTYSLPQVLHEYGILRDFVFAALETTEQMSTLHRDIVLHSFELAIRQAAQAFMDERTEQEDEKRRRVESDRDLKAKQLKRLEADNTLQKTFVATLSHDLRNPIGAVRMALDLLLLEVPSTPDINDLAELMARNLAQTESMLLDLLDANRIKAGHRLPIELSACNLTLLAKSFLAERQSVGGPGCILQMQDDINGFWNADRLRRVIGNLVDNAVKYGQVNGRITLSIDQDSTHTTISVHNDGYPIPVAAQATIFEPHYQAKAANGQPATGWGLGLTLVKAVAEAHGGTVRVESALETGTTFIVTLPNDARPFNDGTESIS